MLSGNITLVSFMCDMVGGGVGNICTRKIVLIAYPKYPASGIISGWWPIII